MAVSAAEPHAGDPSLDEKQVALDHENLGFQNGVQDMDISPEEDKRILRRLDMCLLPMMAISYFFQFLDKGALSSAAILSLLPDLKLTGNDYSWAGSIYYFGYLAASYPAAWVMVRWRVGKLISLSIIAWGAVLMFTALSINSGGLLAVRFFLGVTEAAIAPGLMIMISMWYKREEQPLRQCAWFLGNTTAAIFGSLISYGVGHIKSIAPWKAVFLIFGAITIVWGAVAIFVLPDTPANARFLTKEDRQKAVIRVKDNLTGMKSNQLRWNQVWEALSDYRSWILFLLQISASIPNGGLASFAAIVIRNFKFTVFQTLLLGALVGLVQLVLVIISAAGAAYFKNSRTLWMSWNLVLSIMGSVLVRQLPASNKWGRFMGVATSTAYAVNFPLQLSLLTGNVGGFTKKATVSAMMFVAYCGGNIIGPQLFFADEANKNYPSAFLAIIICLSFCLVLVIIFRYCLIMENKQREKAALSTDKDTVVGGAHGEYLVNLMDKTDRELPQFRYIY